MQRGRVKAAGRGVEREGSAEGSWQGGNCCQIECAQIVFRSAEWERERQEECTRTHVQVNTMNTFAASAVDLEQCEIKAHSSCK